MGSPSIGYAESSGAVKFVGERLTNVSLAGSISGGATWCVSGIKCPNGTAGTLGADGQFTDVPSGNGTGNQAFYLNGTGPMLSLNFGSITTTQLYNNLSSSPNPKSGQQPSVTISAVGGPQIMVATSTGMQ